MIRRFFDQAVLYHKGRSAAFEAEEFALMQLGYPLITLIFYCLIAVYSFQTTNLTSWVIGNSFLLCTNACIFGLGNVFVGERYWGRLRSIIASPCAKLPLILANGVFPAIFAVCVSSRHRSNKGSVSCLLKDLCQQIMDRSIGKYASEMSYLPRKLCQLFSDRL